MKDILKMRVIQYLKSAILIGVLGAFLAKGPCGGAFIGLLVAAFSGTLISSFLWLLNFKWYWRIAIGLLIAITDIRITMLVVQMLPADINEVLLSSLMLTTFISMFIAMIECANYIATKFTTKKTQVNV